jgi:hypothetical protein
MNEAKNILFVKSGTTRCRPFRLSTKDILAFNKELGRDVTEELKFLSANRFDARTFGAFKEEVLQSLRGRP